MPYAIIDYSIYLHKTFLILEEKNMKIFGGNVERKTGFGIIWLAQIFGFGWILALVSFFWDNKELGLEDKRELIACIITALLGFVPVVGGIYGFVCSIIACYKAFTGSTFNVPGAYHLAKAIIK